MKRVIICSLFFLLFGCSTGTKENSHESSNKSSLSELGFKLREAEEIKLKNGLSLIFIFDNKLPQVGLRWVVKAGAMHEGSLPSGINGITAGLVSRGTEKFAATEYFEEWAQLGTAMRLEASLGLTQFSTSALNIHEMKMLDLFYQMMSIPRLELSELEKIKKEQITNLRRKKDNPSQMATEYFEERIHKNHPYGKKISGTEESVKQISLNNVKEYFLKYYRPSNSFLVVSGAYSDEFKNELISKVGRLVDSSVDSLSIPKQIAPNGRSIFFYNKKGLKQSQIRVGHLSIKRSDPLYSAVTVANSVLGGSFNSRLNLRIRTELGLTYGVNSEVDTYKDGGVFSIDTFTRHEKISETISELLSVYSNFIKNGITQEELQNSQAYLSGQYPLSFESVWSYAYVYTYLKYLGLDPESEVRSYIPRIQSLKLTEVNSTIKKVFDDQSLIIVIYADYDLLSEPDRKYLTGLGTFELISEN